VEVPLRVEAMEEEEAEDFRRARPATLAEASVIFRGTACRARSVTTAQALDISAGTAPSRRGGHATPADLKGISRAIALERARRKLLLTECHSLSV